MVAKIPDSHQCLLSIRSDASVFVNPSSLDRPLVNE
jgi:hypothetical protein